MLSKYGARTRPVYKVKTTEGEELVTVIMTGHGLGRYSELTKPIPEHIVQATFYAQAYGLEKILFLYLGKDVEPGSYDDPESLSNFPIKVFEHTVSPLDIAITRSKVMTINESVDQGELPEAEWDDPEEPGAPCGWCGFRNQCKPEHFAADVIPANRLLSDLGRSALTPGAYIKHLGAKDLREEFAQVRPE